MEATGVIAIYKLLKEKGIKIWIDGGWGIDALLEKQTRPHGDLDIAIARKDVEKLRSVLSDYQEKKNDKTTEWNFVLENANGKKIDVHVFEFDENGKNIYGIAYPQESLTGKGIIDVQEVHCIAAEWVLKFHQTYELKEKDIQDIKALCEKFNLKPLENYNK